MNKIKIKSNQIFEDHVDSIEEEYDYQISRTENGLLITYNDTTITINNDIAIIDNKNSTLIIEKEKRNQVQYVTPYGAVNMEIEGKEIEMLEEQGLLKLKYIIRIGNLKEYINELQIEYS